MPSKEIYCYRILKAYSLIVDFDGEALRENVPAPIEGETFKQWKQRVLGNEIDNVVVYVPIKPSPAKRISTLQSKASAEHLEKIFRKIRRDNKIEKEAAVVDATNRTKTNYKTFSKDVLDSYLKDHEKLLEKPVRDTLEDFLKSADENINTEELVTILVEKYNSVVKSYRKKVGLSVQNP